MLNKVSHIIQVQDKDEEAYERYSNMTEYEASKIVENWLSDFGPCKNCGSNNIFPTNIEIGNKKLYDFEESVSLLRSYGQFGSLLILDLNNNYGEIKLDVAGKKDNDIQFLLECWGLFDKIILEIPYDNFIQKKTQGKFEIVFSGIYENGKYNIKIEKIFNYGFWRESIQGRIGQYFFNLI
jgi:hypothetical protein